MVYLQDQLMVHATINPGEYLLYFSVLIMYNVDLFGTWREKQTHQHENGVTGETREGWPLLTVEAEVNGDSKRTNKRGSFLVGSLGLSCRYKRFLFCLGCSAQYKIIFSSPYTISVPLSPSPSKLGRQP